MNIITKFFLLCENSMTDSIGRMSIINIYDVITAKDLPAFHAGLNFVAQFNRKEMGNEQTISARVSVTSPSKKEMLPKKDNIFDVVFPSDKHSMNLQLQIPGVVIEEYGNYVATLYVDDKVLAKYDFKVEMLTNVKAE